MRRRKRQNVVLVPFILAIILVVLLILDKNEVSLFKKPTASTNQNNHVSVTTTIHPTLSYPLLHQNLHKSPPNKLANQNTNSYTNAYFIAAPLQHQHLSRPNFDVDKPTTKPTDPSQNTNDMEDGMGEAKINVLYRQDGDEYSLICRW